MNIFNKISGYNVNRQKSVSLPYTNGKHTNKEIGKILFIRASKMYVEGGERAHS